MLFSHEMDHMPSTPNMNDSLNSLRDRVTRTAALCMSLELKLNASFAQPHQVFSTMKNSLTFILCFALSCLTLSAAPQLSNVVTSSTDAPLGYWLEVEEIAVHSEGELAGQTTYRLAMHMLNDAWCKSPSGFRSWVAFSRRRNVVASRSVVVLCIVVQFRCCPPCVCLCMYAVRFVHVKSEQAIRYPDVVAYDPTHASSN